MSQVRVPIPRLLSLIQELVAESITWAQVMSKFIVVNAGGEEEEEGEESEGVKDSSAAPATAALALTVIESSFRGAFSRPNPARS